MDMDDLQEEMERQWDELSRTAQRYTDELVTYFDTIPEDEDVAWGAVGIGVFLCILGVIFA